MSDLWNVAQYVKSRQMGGDLDRDAVADLFEITAEISIVVILREVNRIVELFDQPHGMGDKLLRAVAAVAEDDFQMVMVVDACENGFVWRDEKRAVIWRGEEFTRRDVAAFENPLLFLSQLRDAEDGGVHEDW